MSGVFNSYPADCYRDIRNFGFIWWKFITYIQGARGPFSTPSKMGKTKKLYDLAVRVFPEGPPTAYHPWVVGPDGTLDDFVTLVSGLLRRINCLRTSFVVRGSHLRWVVIYKEGCFWIIKVEMVLILSLEQ